MSAITTFPDGTKTVRLTRPLDGHQTVLEVRLRPPTYGDFFALGDPTAFVVSAGSWLPTDSIDVIRGYVERLADVDQITLQRLGLVDSLALAQAVKDFFREASSTGSTTPPIT